MRAHSGPEATVLLGPAAAPARSSEAHCPGVVDMHEAEDGWLARIRLPGGMVSAEQLAAIAELACEGTGLVELTARANLQVRGLPAESGVASSQALEAVGLLPSRTHERLRNVLASPLAGRHPLSLSATDHIVAELDRALCADTELAQLPQRFLFALDDGGGAALAPTADVALAAVGEDRFRLLLAGQPTDAVAPGGKAAGLALMAARAFLAINDQRGWRVAELSNGARSIAARLGAQLAHTDEMPASTAVPPGRCRQRDGRFALTALLPLGRFEPGVVTAIAGLARTCSGSVRIAATKSLSFLDLDPATVEPLERGLRDLGLVTQPGSGWEALSACAGLRSCSKAQIDVRSAASARAGVRGSGALREHWSACERRCGEPRDVALSVTAIDDAVAIGEQIVPDVESALSLLATEQGA